MISEFPVFTGKIEHAHTVYTRPSLSQREGPGDEAKPDSDPDMVKQAQTVLADSHTDKNLDEVLVLANVTLDEYTEALEVSNKGSVVLLKREPGECMVNNYNGPVMLAWQAIYSMY